MGSWIDRSVSSRLESRRSLMQLGQLSVRVDAARNWGVGVVLEAAVEPAEISASVTRRLGIPARLGTQVVARG